MKPGLMMVLDQRPERADACVAGMIDALGAVGHPDLRAAQGRHWAAAVIAPPVRLPGCEAGIITDAGDILAWTGDIDLPDTQPQPGTPDATGHRLLRRLRAKRHRHSRFGGWRLLRRLVR